MDNKAQMNDIKVIRESATHIQAQTKWKGRINPARIDKKLNLVSVISFGKNFNISNNLYVKYDMDGVYMNKAQSLSVLEMCFFLSAKDLFSVNARNVKMC